MGKKDPRVDEYIAKAADFAQPILRHLRKVVHAGCPEVEEAMKWSAPHFLYKGMLASMAAFKSHCAFGFWKGTVLAERHGATDRLGEAAGQFGRITKIADLPDEKTLIAYVREAAALNDEGAKVARKPKTEKKADLEVPDDLHEALAKNRKAQATFEGFSPSHKREYVEWLSEAKTDATRKRRLDQAVEWMAEGKSRHWKYVKK
jgi:uncharacterized protein YdeI (YjbR/CyaY-like superfamily)